MPAASQRGFSLVELMIGLALGLFIVGAASTLLVSRIREHRALLIESRLMQDLRAGADLMTRDLRRAGYWGEATAAMWHAGAVKVIANPYTAMTPSAATSDTVSFRFSRDSSENNTVDVNEQFGFRLHKGVIEMQLGSGWQAMTDAGTMTVLSFAVTPQVQEIALQGLCEKPCPSGGTECMPKQQVRSLAVAITGRSTADSSVVRSVRSKVRLRNDAVVGLCPA